uniref:Uncharacterized protein n=1 Tax=Dunaliella tertiolecta TaxID=3047 RepID=A0A7S3VLT1_DUNTE|mmetsp:Transcript_55/g.134  ORF Transcript_55/g.134 Transcript_55/m.134 type:complete len:202 (+) Transcript_55:181-786(+)|eukprot:CAMPEP_0202352034 /NCGR_PEP_ID=MMETSP1126-20121109/8403_1 /ASSEMBLY_ACC=CAM_ASM_000457 /TAXON_ID=3047 /ORGANISM="Dunaliella tertiolecta, Strain CCMP1320" /LENGTH=201 /DNA_ID=CAMNT_0048944195 /DNA_START=170 /DNA_END=775 /DNA_ORIENTATION=+
MAGGVSKYYERAWEYNPDGDRFEDRVGKILSRGHNLRDTFRSQAHQTARRTRAYENEHASGHPPDVNPEYYRQGSDLGSGHREVDKRGMVWVSKDGEVIGPASNQGFATLPPPPTPKQQMTTDPQKLMASLSPEQRSKTLWRKVNPACMEINTRLPVSTNTDHYTYKPELLDVMDKTYNRRKTDFTAFANAKIKYDPGSKK